MVPSVPPRGCFSASATHLPRAKCSSFVAAAEAPPPPPAPTATTMVKTRRPCKRCAGCLVTNFGVCKPCVTAQATGMRCRQCFRRRCAATKRWKRSGSGAAWSEKSGAEAAEATAGGARGRRRGRRKGSGAEAADAAGGRRRVRREGSGAEAAEAAGVVGRERRTGIQTSQPGADGRGGQNFVFLFIVFF